MAKMPKVFAFKDLPNTQIIALYNYFSPRYGVGQLAARKLMRVDLLDADKKYVGKKYPS